MPDVILAPTTLVFETLYRQFSICGRVTITDLVDELGWSRSTIHWHLRMLRELDLITWDEGRAGTLRPLVRAVTPAATMVT